MKNNGAHLWEKNALHVFSCTVHLKIISLIKMYILYNSNIWAFYHNNSFLSVSYLHCFLFVCFHFRPLNKKSKVRYLKLFLLISLKQSCLCAFLFTLGWERSLWRKLGWGRLLWGHLGVFLWGLFMVNITTWRRYCPKAVFWCCLMRVLGTSLPFGLSF